MLRLKMDETTAPLDWIKIAMEITGSFEGSTFRTVTGDFDGMGISVGVLQWNYGQGSLQKKILQPYLARLNAKIMDSYFPAPVSVTASMSSKDALKYVRKVMLDGKTLKAGWAAAWSMFLSQETIKTIQLEAAREIADSAYREAISNNLTSKRSFCWFFDVHVQNGSMKGINKPELTVPQKMGLWVKAIFGNVPVANDVVMPFPVQDEYTRKVVLDPDVDQKNRELWQRHEISLVNDEEGIILFNWMCLRVTRNQWAADVISRKGTIAHRVGYVHGRKYDFRELLS
jgi:hypothetical protein